MLYHKRCQSDLLWTSRLEHFPPKRTAANARRVAFPFVFSRVAAPSRLACSLLKRLYDAAAFPVCPSRRPAFAAALALDITPAGLGLLCAATHLYLEAPRQPHGEAWTEALLTQYFLDLVAEIRKFADEDRVLYQFRPRFPWFNRHCRRDCDNPRWEEDAGYIRFEIGAPYSDPARYAIDFYLERDDKLYIIPVEALQAGALPVAELPRWLARVVEDAPPAHLPARFAMRFSREDLIPGLPMT
jgi:hypothetical protein